MHFLSRSFNPIIFSPFTFKLLQQYAVFIITNFFHFFNDFHNLFYRAFCRVRRNSIILLAVILFPSKKQTSYRYTRIMMSVNYLLYFSVKQAAILHFHLLCKLPSKKLPLRFFYIPICFANFLMECWIYAGLKGVLIFVYQLLHW